MNNRILFRADGSHEIGFGHIVRSLSLAQMLRQHYQISFYCRTIPAGLKKDIEDLGFGCTGIRSEAEFFDALQPGDYAVLDGYQFDSDYQKMIKSKVEKLICIDDMHDKTFAADLIINHAPGVTPEMYDAPADVKFALGPDFALLRPSFLASAKTTKAEQNGLTLLICFGGSDNKNITARALGVAVDSAVFKKIVIVTGAGFQNSEELNSVIKKADNVVTYHALDEKQMALVMFQADVALVPASGILFEALAAGNKVISGMYVENQKNIYNGFKHLNAIIDAGTFTNEEIKKAFTQIHNFKNPEIIDGKSPERFLKIFRELSK